MNTQTIQEREIPTEESDDETLVNECIEELEELVLTLDRYPPGAVAVAIGTYLEGLLGALIDEHLCTADDVRQLLREIGAKESATSLEMSRFRRDPLSQPVLPIPPDPYQPRSALAPERETYGVT